MTSALPFPATAPLLTIAPLAVEASPALSSVSNPFFAEALCGAIEEWSLAESTDNETNPEELDCADREDLDPPLLGAAAFAFVERTVPLPPVAPKIDFSWTFGVPAIEEDVNRSPESIEWGPDRALDRLAGEMESLEISPIAIPDLVEPGLTIEALVPQVLPAQPLTAHPAAKLPTGVELRTSPRATASEDPDPTVQGSGLARRPSSDLPEHPGRQAPRIQPPAAEMRPPETSASPTVTGEVKERGFQQSVAPRSAKSLRPTQESSALPATHQSQGTPQAPLSPAARDMPARTESAEKGPAAIADRDARAREGSTFSSSSAARDPRPERLRPTVPATASVAAPADSGPLAPMPSAAPAAMTSRELPTVANAEGPRLASRVESIANLPKPASPPRLAVQLDPANMTSALQGPDETPRIQPVEVVFEQRGPALNFSVQTDDPLLAAELRRSIGDLAARLEREGFESQIRAGEELSPAASLENLSGETSQRDGSRDGGMPDRQDARRPFSDGDPPPRRQPHPEPGRAKTGGSFPREPIAGFAQSIQSAIEQGRQGA